MKKQFVTYEIALKLKELGFDEECINEYWFTCKKLRFSFESIKNIYHYKRSNSDNNDISLISAYYGIKKSNPSFEPILKSKNAKELIDWLKITTIFSCR